MLGPLHQNQHFFRGGGGATPLKDEIFTLPTKSQTFYAINIFSDSPKEFALFLGLSAAFLTHLTTRATFLSLCVCPQNGIFSLRIAHIAPSL